MKTIGVLCPTKGRPLLAKRMYESVMDTTTDAEVFFYVLKEEAETYRLPNMIVGAQVPLVWKFNVLAETFPHPLMTFMTDDVTCETQGWDERIKAEFERYPDRLACVCGHDGRDDKSRTFWTVSREWCSLLGYFFPPFFIGFHADTWVESLARKAGRLVYLPELMFRHEKIDDETRRRLREGPNSWVSGRDADVSKRMRRYFDLDLDILRAALCEEDNAVQVMQEQDKSVLLPDADTAGERVCYGAMRAGDISSQP